MKKTIIIIALITVFLESYSQSACQGVIIENRATITFAQAYLESMRDEVKTAGKDGLHPIIGVFLVSDICVVDSIVIIELSDTHKVVPYYEVNILDDVTYRFPNRIYVLTKITGNPISTTRIAVGNEYQLTIVPYFPKYIISGDFAPPVIVDNTAYAIHFMAGNVYSSPNIQGQYYISLGE